MSWGGIKGPTQSPESLAWDPLPLSCTSSSLSGGISHILDHGWLIQSGHWKAVGSPLLISSSPCLYTPDTCTLTHTHTHTHTQRTHTHGTGTPMHICGITNMIRTNARWHTGCARAHLKQAHQTHKNSEQGLISLTDACKSYLWIWILSPKWAGEMVPTTDHLPKELLRSVSKERDAAHQELVQDDAHSPPVHWLPIALPQDHLRRNVLRGPTYLGTEKLGGSASWDSHLAWVTGWVAGWVGVLPLLEQKVSEWRLSALWLMSRSDRSPRLPEVALSVGWVYIFPN